MRDKTGKERSGVLAAALAAAGQADTAAMMARGLVNELLAEESAAALAAGRLPRFPSVLVASVNGEDAVAVPVGTVHSAEGAVAAARRFLADWGLGPGGPVPPAGWTAPEAGPEGWAVAAVPARPRVVFRLVPPFAADGEL